MISQAMLKVAQQDRQTKHMLAGMVRPEERVQLGDRWAKFSKDGARAYTVHMGIGEHETEALEVSNQTIAKSEVINWVTEKETTHETH